MIVMIRDENPHWLTMKEGRALLRRCLEIVAIGPGEQDETGMGEVIEAATKYVGSAGQMIWKGSDYWQKHKPKKTNEDWIELDRHLANKRKKASKPFRDMPGFSEIVYSLGGTIRNGKAMCRCPAHADKSPSLSITEKDGRVLMHCFAGCTFEQVMDAMKGIANARG